jgi:hypothetical protein
MNTLVKSPQAHCKAAIVRCDITPPIGIYHRMWGAALHDRATGIHRPLEATLLWLEPTLPTLGQPKIVLSLDHCILDPQEIQNIRQAIHSKTGIDTQSIMVTLTHTHGAGWMSRTRSELPGGELLGPYLDDLAIRMGQLAADAQNRVVPASIVYGTGRCDLAAHRDFFDRERNRFVCGFNPAGPADDSLLLAKIEDTTGTILGTVINYACHPTTLAWDNTLISPDWVGAMRELVERELGGLSLFLQGASGDLGPREGFVGDTAVADRNGRQVAYAALSAFTSFPKPDTEYRYSGPVISGTAIGTWRHEPLASVPTSFRLWHWEELIVDLPYRHDLPTIEQTSSEREHWQAEEQLARKANNELRVRDCRAQVEQRTRQLNRLNHLAPGRFYPLTVHVGIVGEAIWIFLPGELYQIFQMTLRARLSPLPVFVTTLTNDWQPGYIPPASSYGYEIYQEVIAATAPGCSEILIEAILRRLKKIMNSNLPEIAQK